MGRDINKEIQESLDYIAYNGDRNNFYKEYKEYLRLLGYKDSKLSHTRIVLAYCLRNIKESSSIKTISVEEVKFRKNKLVNALDKFLKRFNDLGKKGARLGTPLIGRVKSEESYLIYFPRVNTSYIQKKTRAKANLFNTSKSSFSAIYISKKDKKIYCFRMSDYLYGWAKWFLKSKMKVKFDKPIVKKYSSSLLKQMFGNKITKVFELEIRYPEIDESGAIIIKSLNGTGQNYQKRIEAALNISKKGSSIYNIDHAIIS